MKEAYILKKLKQVECKDKQQTMANFQQKDNWQQTILVTPTQVTATKNKATEIASQAV
jgi:hypothetical protein